MKGGEDGPMQLLVCPGCEAVGEVYGFGSDTSYICPACGYYFLAREAKAPPDGECPEPGHSPFLNRAPARPGPYTREDGPGEEPPPG
jgi:hypothetical protein